jgi:hypothetical protein
VTKAPADIRSLCRSYTATTVKTVAGIAESGTSEMARLHASAMLWERGWGRPAQPVTGEDGEGAIEITVRVITEGKK